MHVKVGPDGGECGEGGSAKNARRTVTNEANEKRPFAAVRKAAVDNLDLAPEAVVALVEVSHYRLPPPCIYLLPATIPSPRNNPNPPAQKLGDVEILKAFADCFKANEHDVNSVTFAVAHDGPDTVRSTTVVRDGMTQRTSNRTAIRRT
jgi:hypothetical protein